jgi:hypothetical protein
LPRANTLQKFQVLHSKVGS